MAFIFHKGLPIILIFALFQCSYIQKKANEREQALLFNKRLIWDNVAPKGCEPQMGVRIQAQQSIPVVKALSTSCVFIFQIQDTKMLDWVLLTPVDNFSRFNEKDSDGLVSDIAVTDTGWGAKLQGSLPLDGKNYHFILYVTYEASRGLINWLIFCFLPYKYCIRCFKCT